MAEVSPELLNKFKNLVAKDVNAQTELFLKSFIFALGDDWKLVVKLSKAFVDYLNQLNEGSDDLNAAQAADFLQKNGKTRTAPERRAELKDIDLDKNDRIAFIEYLLLHFKAMILREYYKRTGERQTEDLSRDGIGVCNVGAKLLDELFTLPMGLDPALERAIEEFTSKKRERESRLRELGEKAKQGGVKGMTAKNEIEQMNSQDSTEMNRMELTLEAAKKRAQKDSGEVALRKKQEEQAAAEKAKLDAGRNKLKGMAALWEQK
eukprot:CAMPEP_0177655194 /NCGR_PEP_ID=MMETSP0447-20121125/14812_1 /TAXON_ID=0 /ORGANISM="Stygamoeba regulata, Strain BSH-02190019" /LENGTH=263 /DNA_ID=CAMNT_0019159047 /DNA_START=69 /DNA_END=860 /DNA_ORIENTATION=-